VKLISPELTSKHASTNGNNETTKSKLLLGYYTVTLLLKHIYSQMFHGY